MLVIQEAIKLGRKTQNIQGYIKTGETSIQTHPKLSIQKDSLEALDRRIPTRRGRPQRNQVGQEVLTLGKGVINNRQPVDIQKRIFRQQGELRGS